jgi:cytochrome c2
MMACTTCHETDKGGKIAASGKEWAHKTCKGCHEEKNTGPTNAVSAAINNISGNRADAE